MIAFEYLYNRRVPIVYTAPAVCEFDFSGTGEPSIYLAPIARVLAPSGLVLGGEGGFTIFWGVIPGALCYSVYKAVDADDPYGPYELVAECIANNWFTAPDPGVYRVEVITEDGTSDLSDPVEIPSGGGPPGPPPPPPPPPATCGNGSPPVPSLLLEDLDAPELVVEGSHTNGTTLVSEFPFEVGHGQFAVRWVSGHVYADCDPIPIKESWKPHTYWQYGADLGSSWSIGQQFGGSASGTPPDTTPPVEDQLLAAYPDRLFPTNVGSPSEIIITPSSSLVGETHKFVLPGSPNGFACSGPKTGGTYIEQIVKIKEWIVQPEFVTISNWASIRKSLFCNADADAGPAWNGIIGDSVYYAINGFQLAESNHGEYVGSAQVSFAEVWLVAGVKWRLTLMAYIGGSLTVVFSGEKYYGRTCVGNYGKVSGCTEETCVTLV